MIEVVIVWSSFVKSLKVRLKVPPRIKKLSVGNFHLLESLEFNGINPSNYNNFYHRFQTEIQTHKNSSKFQTSVYIKKNRFPDDVFSAIYRLKTGAGLHSERETIFQVGGSESRANKAPATQAWFRLLGFEKDKPRKKRSQILFFPSLPSLL